LSVSESWKDFSTSICEEDEYTSLEVTDKKVTLKEAKYVGDYRVSVRLIAHNGVIADDTYTLRFRVDYNEIVYNNAMTAANTEISMAGDGTFEMFFTNDTYFPFLSAPFYEFRYQVSISNSYAAITDVTETGIKGKVYYLAPSSKATSITVTVYENSIALSSDYSTTRSGVERSSVKFSARDGQNSGWTSGDRRCMIDLITHFYSINTQENVDTFFANMAAAGKTVDESAKCSVNFPLMNEYIQGLGYDIDFETDDL